MLVGMFENDPYNLLIFFQKGFAMIFTPKRYQLNYEQLDIMVVKSRSKFCIIASFCIINTTWNLTWLIKSYFKWQYCLNNSLSFAGREKPTQSSHYKLHRPKNLKIQNQFGKGARLDGASTSLPASLFHKPANWSLAAPILYRAKWTTSDAINKTYIDEDLTYGYPQAD